MAGAGDAPRGMPADPGGGGKPSRGTSLRIQGAPWGRQWLHHLDAEDRARIAAIIAQGTGLEGDVYTLERDRHGRHGSIMHYNLNAGKK